MGGFFGVGNGENTETLYQKHARKSVYPEGGPVQKRKRLDTTDTDLTDLLLSKIS
jgi:hypothetical protein